MNHQSRRSFSLWLDHLPPSDNTRRRWLTKQEKDFYALINHAAARFGNPHFKIPVSLRVWLVAPDHRRRDATNYLKCLCDALQYAGIVKDDTLIRMATIELYDRVAAHMCVPEKYREGGTFLLLEKYSRSSFANYSVVL